jgi:hypothetical protein
VAFCTSLGFAKRARIPHKCRFRARLTELALARTSLEPDMRPAADSAFSFRLQCFFWSLKRLFARPRRDSGLYGVQLSGGLYVLCRKDKLPELLARRSQPSEPDPD